MNLDSIRIVLVATSHPGNIGSTARAMKTMGLSSLYLVSPKSFPDSHANAMAAGSDDVLEQAIVVPTLSDALKGAQLIFATSARSRDLDLPGFEPYKAAQFASEQPNKTQIAFVFGREHAGLTNDELLHCHYHIHIPTEPTYSSLNLSQAVQIIAYEIRKCFMTQNMSVDPKPMPLAKADDVERFYEHFESLMVNIEFLNPKKPGRLMQRIRRMFNRVQLEQQEVNILRGILTDVKKHLEGCVNQQTGVKK